MTVGGDGLQGLVNNAGVGVGGPIEYLGEDDWRYVFEVNFFGVVAMSRAAMPLLETGRGRVVAHRIDRRPHRVTRRSGPYSASKHALEALAGVHAHRVRSERGPRCAWSADRTGRDPYPDLGQGRSQRRRVRPIGSSAVADSVRERYGWLVDQSARLRAPRPAEGHPAESGGRRSRARAHRAAPEGPLSRRARREDRRPRHRTASRPPSGSDCSSNRVGSKQLERFGATARRELSSERYAVSSLVRRSRVDSASR